MAAMEDAVDAAAKFVRPFVTEPHQGQSQSEVEIDPWVLVQQAIVHLEMINDAELAAAPDSPYDTSLAGTVYGLLDLITSIGLLPLLSPDVVFAQRPQSVIKARFATVSADGHEAVFTIVKTLLSILEQPKTGVQPLLSQRILPDVLSALSELAFSPESSGEIKNISTQRYQRTISEIPTSRLLPLLTSYLQQDLPLWLKHVLSKELALIPLRKRGIRHTVEFLSLSYLPSTTRASLDASKNDLQSQMPIPLEAIAQASKLLVHPPLGWDQGDWLRALSPQLLELLDGVEGKEMSRAAGYIIAGGILSKRSTGAPGTMGWEIFAQPIIHNLSPPASSVVPPSENTGPRVIVGENELETSLTRLLNLCLSYSHAGLIKRLVSPVLLPLWALLNYARSRPTLSREWIEIGERILFRYVTITGDAAQLDKIIKNIFWVDPSWKFAPGPRGGVEIREWHQDTAIDGIMESILERIADLDSRIALFSSLLKDVHDEVVGSLFTRSTKRWLSETQNANRSLTTSLDVDPLAALTDAKLVQMMISQFKDIFARSPKHIVELVEQLLRNFVDDHHKRGDLVLDSSKLRRSDLRTIMSNNDSFTKNADTGEELVTFALSILNTVITAPGFKRMNDMLPAMERIIALLRVLTESRAKAISPTVYNSANSIRAILEPASIVGCSLLTNVTDPLAQDRKSLAEIMTELQSPDAPIRTWALSQLLKLIESPTAFAVVDIPATTYTLMTVSLVDSESYVHTAAVPVLVTLAKRASRPVIQIIVDAFVDVDEHSLGSTGSRKSMDKESSLENAIDFRLRVGEVLDKLLLDDDWNIAPISNNGNEPFIRIIAEGCLMLASRRGQRVKTQSLRAQIAEDQQRSQEEGERAWDGPIPNLLDPEGEGEEDDPERNALLQMVQGWQDTGLEEDVRIRASALGVLASLVEHRFGNLHKNFLKAVLQATLLILTIETSTPKIVLRRSALLSLLGLLKGRAAALVDRDLNAISLDLTDQTEIERVVAWTRHNDNDSLVQGHATAVLESLEALKMREIYTASLEKAQVGYDAGILKSLRGLEVKTAMDRERMQKRLIVEELD